MDPALLLVGSLFLFHLVEGAFWVRRSAFVFLNTRRGWVMGATSSPLGNANNTFVFGRPWPPLRPLTVVELWPVTFFDNEVVNRSKETVGLETLPLFGFRTLGPKEAATARADGKRVLAGGRPFVTTSSGVFSVLIAEALRDWAGRPEGQRAKVNEQCRRAHGSDWVRARLLAYESETRWLKWLCNLVPIVLIGAVYGIFFVHAFFVWWPWVLGVSGALLVACWALFVRIHRRLYPTVRHERWYKLLLLVSAPLATARCHVWLARDLFAGAHPLEVAGVLHSDETLRDLAGRFWRDIQHPLRLSGYVRVPQVPLAKARERAMAEFRRMLKARGISGSELEVPAGEGDAGCSAFCPRCLEFYARPKTECVDCIGVQCRAFPAPRRASGAGALPRTVRDG